MTMSACLSSLLGSLNIFIISTLSLFLSSLQLIRLTKAILCLTLLLFKMTIFRFCFRYIYRSLSSSLLYLFVFSLYSLCSYSFYLSFLSIPLLLISLYPSLLFLFLFIPQFFSIFPSLSIYLFVSTYLSFLSISVHVSFLFMYLYLFLSFFSKGTHFRRVRMRLNQT